MYDAAEKEGLDLRPEFCYRSTEKQAADIEKYVAEQIEKGLSPEDAREETIRYCAVPGTSEHETGLAVDIVTGGDENFKDTAEYAWLQENAATYGFVMRYPADKEAVTHIGYEPWHYRFAGASNAKGMLAAGRCLEEYLQAAE